MNSNKVRSLCRRLRAAGERIGKEMTAPQSIALGFLVVIAIGTALLLLPISVRGEGHAPFSDALFTACSSVCVTGLTVVETGSYWSAFGQLVILLLIQCGGLGVVAFTTAVTVMLGRRVTLRDRIVLESAFNLNALSGLVGFLGSVLKGTFFLEALGALCYIPVFVPRFGARGIWISVFTSVSAVCNCGMDIIGPDGLAPYADSLWVNAVTSVLVITGGLGFIVWRDIFHVVRKTHCGEIPRRHALKRLSLHTKLTLVTSGTLLLGGFLTILLLEYRNPATLGGLPLGKKLMAAFFQSMTTRSAGFVTIPQSGLREPTVLVCMFLMFVGGSSVGTAGGVKTTTLALMILSAAATAKGSDDVVVFRRTIPRQKLLLANAVVLISFAVTCVMTVLLNIIAGGSLMTSAFETLSAISTAGMTLDYTAGLNALGRAIIIICMYLGRIGPISLAIAINFRQNHRNLARFAEEDVTVG